MEGGIPDEEMLRILDNMGNKQNTPKAVPEQPVKVFTDKERERMIEEAEKIAEDANEDLAPIDPEED